MDFWIIQRGEKAGPFNDYEIRDRIESGELGPETRVWYEGADGWIRIPEVEIFRTEFERVEELSVSSSVAPPPLPNPPRPFLRFMARWFDFFLYTLLIFGVMRVLGFDIAAALMSPMFVTLHLMPWVVLEAIAVHLWKTTPGKWLMGFRVQGPDGEVMGLSASVLRAFRVFVLGMGMNLSFLVLIAHGFGIWFLLRFGVAPWDRMGGSEARHIGLTPPRIAAFVVGFFVILMALGVVLEPASLVMEEELRKLYPQLFELLPERPDPGA